MDETKKTIPVESSLPELPETELKQVVGGSTTLSGACCTGTHIVKATT